MTNSIAEIEFADVILVSGSNTTVAHPQVARRIYDAVDRGAKLIVIDPRSTRIARLADIHLQLESGSDIPLLNGMMRCILDANLQDHDFMAAQTENYQSLHELLMAVDLDEVAATTGVAKSLIQQAAQLYAKADLSSICYCLGVTQHVSGTHNVQSYANLAMLTGHIARPSTGVNPLRGQNNVQGACDMGGLPNVYPGYQAVTDEAVRAKFEQAWGVPLSNETGRPLLQMTHGGDTDNGLSAMLIVGENPMLSDPGLKHVEATLKSLDFLAVADLFLTETAQLADVVFPAASFAEKTGTVTNSERRVQLMNQAIEPLGECKTDSEIIMELSQRMGYPMAYESSAAVMEEICSLTPLYGGMHHDRLLDSWGLQWPCFDRHHPGTNYLHRGEFTRGRGCFSPAEPIDSAEYSDNDYPFVLITGRSYHHYHTGTMTRRCAMLNREHSLPWLEMHPDDAQRLGLSFHDRVVVASRRGQCSFHLCITDSVKSGDLYCDFHFHEAPVNDLTLTAADPIANCPEFKRCAVQVSKETL